MGSVRRRAFFTLAAALAAPAIAPAEVRLPALVGSHMVLQRDAPARVWGWAEPGEAVRVSVGTATGEAVAGADGRWSLDLPAQPAGGPFPLTIAGSNTVTLEDVWFGEVWVASGQSNMEWPLGQSNGGPEAAASGCDGLRLFTVAKATSLREKDDVTGRWAACDASTAPGFSAVAFFFGRELHRALGVKVGLVHSSWGDVGARLARWALADTYGRPGVKSGPLYRSSSPEGGTIRVRFEHAQGLTTSDGVPPRAFAVAGADRKWRWAEARIDGEAVVASSPQVRQPVAVRYAWADNPEATLRNGAGLPASPFRTDDWPMLTMDAALFDTRTLKTSGPLPAASGGPVASIRNPVIPGFHPDPSVVRVGGDFYLVTSSFEFFPGVPIFTSRDLVHWKQIGHVLTRESQLPLQKARPSGGIYAPTLRYHDGTFYMITTNVDGGGNFYVTAKDPAGPWSEPVWLRDFGGIDPSLFFDDDGTVYLTGQGSGAPGQPRGIYQTTLDVKTGTMREPLRLVWDRTGTRYPEAPHLYKIEGRYYLMIAEGGTEYGHMVKVARSDSPWGPFEACPRNPILTNRQTQNDVPVQGTGHADLVEALDRSWWMVFLAFRPVSGNWHHLGRETFLAPVAWDADGWPIVNGGQPAGLEVKAAALPAQPFPPPPMRTGFDAPLGPEWNHLRDPRHEAYALDARPGWLTLCGDATSLGEAASPTWVGRRQEHLSGRVATLVDFVPVRDGEEAGLSVYMSPDHRYEIGVGRANGRRQVFVRQRIGPYLEAVTASAPLDGTEPVVLQVEATPEEYAFSFGVAMSGRPQVATTPLGKAAARYLSSEVAGGFTGVYFGLYATGNGGPASAPAHFDWFDDEPRKD